MDYPKLFGLKGKTVWVAGGLGLIGAESCRALASMGAKVLILDMDKAKVEALAAAIVKEGGQAHGEVFDIADLPGIEPRMDEIFKKYGAMDAWVNITYPRTKDWPKPLEQMTVDYLRGNMDAHLNSCLWSGRKAALLMRTAKIKGSIVHFGSIYGVQANDLRIYEGTAMAGEIVYCAIKGGTINLTRYLASHFGPAGIRANSICPGGIGNNQDPKFVEKYVSRTPLKRMGTPQDIASSVVFLASEASSYVTGTTFMVDGGWTIV